MSVATCVCGCPEDEHGRVWVNGVFVGNLCTIGAHDLHHYQRYDDGLWRIEETDVDLRKLTGEYVRLVSPPAGGRRFVMWADARDAEAAKTWLDGLMEVTK